MSDGVPARYRGARTPLRSTTGAGSAFLCAVAYSTLAGCRRATPATRRTLRQWHVAVVRPCAGGVGNG
jgi:hypothetical protein